MNLKAIGSMGSTVIGSAEKQTPAKNRIIQIAKAIKERGSRPAEVYNSSHVAVRTFNEWSRDLERAENPDHARALLYYGFQPLYDALAEGIVPTHLANMAFESMYDVLRGTQDFLTGYYTGNPDMDVVREVAETARGPFEKLKDVGYRIKSRNIDNGHGYQEVENVARFLAQSLEHVDRLPEAEFPQALIGCACGSSELMLPLAAVLDVPFGFIRMSKRRRDSKPLILEQERQHLSTIVNGKPAACIEDCVNSGRSLGSVMLKTRELGASSVFGMAAYYCYQGDSFKPIKKEKIGSDFTRFTLEGS